MIHEFHNYGEGPQHYPPTPLHYVGGRFYLIATLFHRRGIGQSRLVGGFLSRMLNIACVGSDCLTVVGVPCFLPGGILFAMLPIIGS